MEIKKGRHSTYLLHAHLVFIVKYRKSVLTKEYLSYLNDLFKSSLEDMGAELIEFNGESDHVHLLIQYTPMLSMEKIINNLKGKSSRLLRRDYPEIKKTLWGKAGLWSRSYFAGSVGGAPIEILKEYIKNQDAPES